MDWFIWWGMHAPMWQLYTAMTVSGLMLILLLWSMLPNRMRAHLWGKGDTAAKRSGYAKTVVVEYEEVPSHVFAVRNAKGAATLKKSDKTSQEGNGTKTDCSASQMSAASVTNLFST